VFCVEGKRRLDAGILQKMGVWKNFLGDWGKIGDCEFFKENLMSVKFCGKLKIEK
jgi:hypothetical protein